MLDAWSAKRAAYAEGAYRADSKGEAAVGKPRILVVDDEVGVRESLRVILRPQYEVTTVESGEAALDALPAFQPDLVFIDLKMPAMDGLELLQRIKTFDPTIEVVMITAYASLETLKRAVSDGVFEYLIKPFSRRDLEETARRALDRRTGGGRASGLAWIPEVPGVAPSPSRAADLLAFTEKGHQFDALARLAQAVMSSLAPAEVLDRVARAAINLFPDSASRIWVVEEDRLVLRAEAGIYGAPQSGLKTVLAFGEGLMGIVAASRHPLVVTDVLADPRTINTEWMRREGYVSLVSIPLLAREQLVGALALLTRHRHSFSEAELEILTSFGTQAAIAIEHARLFEEAERRRQAAESLAEMGHLISQSLDSQEVGQRIAQSVHALLHVQASVLYRLDAETGDLVAVAFSGDVGPIEGERLVIPHGTGLVGLALRERRLVVTPDTLSDPRVTHSPENRARIEQASYRATLAVPLTAKEGVIGALAVGDRSGRVFTADEMRLAQAFADQAATAIQNAQLFRDSSTRQARLEALLEVGRQISRLQPVESVFRTIAVECGRLLGADGVGFRLLEGDELVVSATWGAAAEVMLVSRLKIGQSLSGIVAQTGEPLLVVDPTRDPRLIPAHRESLSRLGLRAILILPLKIGDRVTGTLSIHSRQQRGFSQEDLAIATTFASQAAVALENGRLYGELNSALKEVEASQRQIVQTERLRALGEMAGGVAHDFNNTLTVVLARTHLLLNEVQDPEIQRKLQVIEKAALDGAQTVRRIREFTRTQPARPFTSVDLNRVVEEVVEITRSRWKDEAQAANVPYDVLIEPGSLPPVLGDAAELREALTNIVFNALDAMPGGGRITFRTGVEGDRVYCVVSDTGVGMTDEVRRRLFEPFFTTKGDRGTGLGLSVVFGIVRRHGGEIEVESQVGAGSTFTIRLPAGQEVREISEANPSVQPHRAATILIIDDDEEVREVLGDLLVGQGHTVVARPDGESGLACLEEKPFDLVITDLAMPGLSGWQVASLVRLRNSGIPVAVLTGFSDGMDVNDARARGADFLVAKPFKLEDITTVVAQALARKDL